MLVGGLAFELQVKFEVAGAFAVKAASALQGEVPPLTVTGRPYHPLAAWSLTTSQ